MGGRGGGGGGSGGEEEVPKSFFFSFRPRKVGGTVVTPFNISPSDREMVRLLRFSANLQDVNHRTENQDQVLSSLLIFTSISKPF